MNLKQKQRILIKTTKEVKTNIFKQKQQLSSVANIRPYEVLTQKRLDLLNEAKNLCQMKLLKSAYSFNGSIMIKTNDSDTPIKIHSLFHLTNVTKK